MNIPYPPIRTHCVSGGKKSLFHRKFGVLCFLTASVFRFTLFPYYRQYVSTQRHNNFSALGSYSKHKVHWTASASFLKTRPSTPRNNAVLTWSFNVFFKATGFELTFQKWVVGFPRKITSKLILMSPSMVGQLRKFFTLDRLKRPETVFFALLSYWKTTDWQVVPEDFD